LPAYAGLFDDLPMPLGREDVQQVVDLLDDGTGGSVNALVASYVWGSGRVGYGPSRAAKILAGPPEQAGRALQRAGSFAREAGPLAGYVALSSEFAVPHLGPAFGTKYLHFVSHHPGAAPILDRLISEWFGEFLGVNLTATKWHPSSYALYVQLLTQWAGELHVDRCDIEQVIFRSQARKAGSQWA
jgi:hypothetical protein